MFARRDVRCLAVLAGLSLLAPSAGAQEKGKKYAVVVGVNAYDHASLTPLEYAENDAEELGRLLAQPKAGFTKVRVLTTARGKKKPADAPTAKNIQAALAEVYRGKTRRDTVLVALSGHGVQLEIRDPAGKGRDRTYPFFCPTDGQINDTDYATGKSPTLINLDHLLTALGDCGAGSKLLLVDACRNKVRARNVDVGQLINAGAGTQMFRVSAIDVLRVYVNVPQIYSQSAMPGTAARLTLSEFPGQTFTGKLVRTARAIDPSSRTLLVEIDVDNRDGKLMPGAFTQVHLNVHGGFETLVIPVASLIFRGQGLQVGTVVKGPNGDEAKLVQITLGQDDGSTVQVIHGLDANAPVIADPPDSLVDGELVHVVQPKEQREQGPHE